jgi:uncharacterized protein YraI
MRLALDSTDHRVPRTKPNCLLRAWRPHRQWPFVLVLHLHQHQSSRNLHLQYLAKNQSTQHCQSLITPGSDHPPVLEPQMVLNLPLDECIDNTHIVTWEEGKRKETNKRKLQQAIESQRNAKSKITWREQVSDPLSKGNGSTHLRQNYAQAKSANHQTKTQKPQRAPPGHMQAPPKPMQLPPDECMQTSWWKQSSCISLALTGQTGRHHRSDRCSTCEQDQPSDRSDRWPRPVWPVTHGAQKWLETTWKPSKCIQYPKTCSNFSPLLTMLASSQKLEKCNLELIK